MKTKIILRLLPKDQYIQKSLDISNSTSNLSHLETKIITPICPSSNDEVFYYEDIEPKSTIADLIVSISQQKKICPDTLQLYLQNQNNIKLLKDIENLNEIISLIENNNSIQNPLSTHQEHESSKNKNDYILFYYTMNNVKMKISVDFYQMKIDKIYLKLAFNCSILMLKYIISSKLNKMIPTQSQKLFGLGLLAQGNKVQKIPLNNKEFNDELRLIDIVNDYDNNSNESNISNYALHFLLTRNNNNKLQMGLNFKFNYFKNVTKIPFKENAPKYCECSDGLNLFCYCRNTSCELFNQLFVHILGYGCYEIIKESQKLKCPICEDKKTIELKNLGLINAKWIYKGILNGQKTNVFEGDGITVDHQLYILKEAKIYNLVYKLYVDVKPYFAKDDNTTREQKDINKEGSDNCDLDDISLNVKNCVINQDANENEFLISNVSGAKVINNDEDLRSMDVMIHGIEKNICGDCLNNNECFVF